MLKAINKKLFPLLVLILLFLSLSVSAAEQLKLDTVLQRIDQHYPSLQIAARQVERARQDVIVAQSQLGWNLSAQAGYNHGLGTFNTVTDTMNYGVSVNKQLESGSTFSVGTNLSDQNIDEATLDPGLANFIANPQQTMDVELSYRMPFAKGADNPAYQLAINNSRAGVMMSQASERSLRDQMANQVIQLYYGAAQAQAGLNSAADGVHRAEALVEYVKNNMRLGLAEEKDLLQFDAQLRIARVALKNAKLQWNTQRTSLNRLMGTPWDQDFDIVVDTTARAGALAYEQLLKEAQDYSPVLLRHQAEMMMAEAALTKARNDKQSQFDIVASIGNTSVSGTYPTSTFSESGNPYGLRFEYSRALDGSGFDAKLYQAQIDKGIAQQNIQQATQDLQYNLNSLVTEIHESSQSLELTRQRLDVERKRFADVKQRYKSGRVDNSQLIMAEGDLSQGELSLKQTQIDLAMRQAQLDAMRGTLWQSTH